MSIALSSVSAFTVAVSAARSVDFAAYTLRPGATRDALMSAAHGGATVRVRLERDPLDDATGSLHNLNRDAIAALTAAGADAALTLPDTPVMHMKAATVDGVAWLDDRNWAGDGHETVLRDSDPADVAAVTAALNGGAVTAGDLRTTKAGALSLEADLVRTAGQVPLALESESFGSGAIYNALLARARSGLPSRLLVAAREAAQAGNAGDIERRRLARLQALGVEVRTGKPATADLDEKLAVSGEVAWIGSANATSAWGAAGEQRDWGLITSEQLLIDGLRAAYERNWAAARPFIAREPQRE